MQAIDTKSFILSSYTYTFFKLAKATSVRKKNSMVIIIFCLCDLNLFFVQKSDIEKCKEGNKDRKELMAKPLNQTR